MYILVNVNYRDGACTIANDCNAGMSKDAYVDAVLSGVGEALHNNSDIIVQ